LSKAGGSGRHRKFSVLCITFDRSVLLVCLSYASALTPHLSKPVSSFSRSSYSPWLAQHSIFPLTGCAINFSSWQAAVDALQQREH
jgi:hypothetical protein